MSQTVHETIARIAKELAPSYDSMEIALQNAWHLLELCTKKSQAQLLATSLELTQEQEQQLQEYMYQISVLKKPIQYIIGNVPFLDLTIKVVTPILIPRPETEEWCSYIIELYKKNRVTPHKILDLCSGTGCITLALAQAFPTSSVLGIDINEQALDLARENQKLNGIHNCTFMYSNMFDHIDKTTKFDLIVSNPPYISRQEWQALDDQVAWWEDPRALVAEQNGYFFIQKILKESKHYLTTQEQNLPNLCIEIGAEQGPASQKYALESGYKNVSLYKDLYARNRAVMIIY